MVLELIVNPRTAENHPLTMFFYGLLFAGIAIAMSVWVFSEWASLMMLFLTTISCVYLIERTLKLEAKKDVFINDERRLLLEHSKALLFFFFLFLGFTLAFSLAYVFMSPVSVEQTFSHQIAEFDKIDSYSGNVSSESGFFIILSNNFKVLFFTTFFAFFYGAGVIFILAWNASIIGVAIGNVARRIISDAASQFGAAGFTQHFHAISLGVGRYMIHGVFEIFAYFIAALAGGIISVAVINKHITGKGVLHIIMDGADLLAASAVILVFAAAVEVFLTPVLFAGL